MKSTNRTNENKAQQVTAKRNTGNVRQGKNKYKKILNDDDFSTYCFIINIEKVTDKSSKEYLQSNCKTVNGNVNRVFVTARAFNYLELLLWLNSKFGLSIDYLMSLRPKIYKNTLSKVNVDLTTIKHTNHGYIFECKVDKERQKLRDFSRQNTTINSYNKDTLKYLKKVTDDAGSITDILVEFTFVNNNNERSIVTHKTKASSNLGGETSHQAKVRQAFRDCNFSGMLFNTGHLVTCEQSDSHLLYIAEDIENILNRVNSSKSMNIMPYTRIDVNCGDVTEDMFDVITIADCFNATVVDNNMKQALINYSTK